MPPIGLRALCSPPYSSSSTTRFSRAISSTTRRSGPTRFWSSCSSGSSSGPRPSWCARRIRSRFDLVYRLLPAQAQRLAAIARHVLVGGVFLVALPGSLGYIRFLWREHTPVLNLPLDLVYSCFGMFLVAVIVRALLRRRAASRSRAGAITSESGQAVADGIMGPARRLYAGGGARRAAWVGDAHRRLCLPDRDPSGRRPRRRSDDERPLQQLSPHRRADVHLRRQCDECERRDRTPAWLSAAPWSAICRAASRRSMSSPI